VLFLFVYCLLLTVTCVLFAGNSWADDYSDISASKSKDWTQSMQDACLVLAPMWLKYMIWREVWCSSSSWRSQKKSVAGVLFRSFTMVGSQIWEGNWTSNPVRVPMSMALYIGLVDVNIVPLSWMLSCHGLNSARNAF